MKEFFSLLTFTDLLLLFSGFLLVFFLLRLYLLRREQILEKKAQIFLKEKLGLINLGLTKSKTLHEINNLLTVALLNFTLLEEESKEKNNLLKEGFKALKELKRLLKANQNQNRCLKDKSYFSPSKQVEQALIFLKPKIKEKGILAQKNLERKLKVFGSKTAFYQVVSNLLLNSVEAYKTTGQTLSLQLRNKEGALIFLIKDHAGGIPQEHLTKIFDPFFTTKKEGSGLGLCICKEIIENDFSGKITVESQQGKGSVFKITIPPKQSSS